MADVERSPGIVVTAGSVPFIVGGGGHGENANLDTLISDAAVALSDLYDGHKVTIRFNSDRQSGGAWLKTADPDAIGENAEIGICGDLVSREMLSRGWAGLRDLDLPDMTFAKYLEQRCGGLYNYGGPDEQVFAITYIKRGFLRNPDELAQDDSRHEAVSYVYHRSLGDAIAYLGRQAVPDPYPILERRRRKAAAALAMKVLVAVTYLAEQKKADLVKIGESIGYPHFLYNDRYLRNDAIRAKIVAAVKAGAWITPKTP